LEGDDVDRLDPHSGGYRVQRVPPTERRGRVHTSTVTVAVLAPGERINTGLRDEDLKIEWFSGTGAGGQHRNKSQNSCRLTHVPTGIVEARQTRSREASYRDAREAISKRLIELEEQQSHSSFSSQKSSKVGSGMRGDKILTIQFQNDRVTHHVTGKSTRASTFMRGQMEVLW
jgi:peptide chain release factor 1